MRMYRLSLRTRISSTPKQSNARFVSVSALVAKDTFSKRYPIGTTTFPRIFLGTPQHHSYYDSSTASTTTRCFSTAAPAEELTTSSAYESIPNDVASIIDGYAQMPHTPASLQMLMRTGRGEMVDGKQKYQYQTQATVGRMGQRLARERILTQVASFVRREIPIRLAHRIQDLDQVPLMRDMPSVQEVKHIYIQSFLEMIDSPNIQTPQDEADFAAMLENLYLKHSNVLVKMARGAFELRQAVRSGQPQEVFQDLQNSDAICEFEGMKQCHKFLDRFYSCRIGVRVLAGQYLALRGKPWPDYIGMICLETSPSKIVRQAANDATKMCMRSYDKAPEVELVGRTDLTLAYIPTYLHYILLELLKNALRATVETHMDKTTLPPVTVIIADGTENEDCVIKIEDKGGGIPRSQINKIWSYLFTTADPSIQEAFIAEKDHSNTSPMAGLGYGLPISRSYCRYFGGDMDIISMEGYGTDAFIHLKRVGDSKEPVPV